MCELVHGGLILSFTWSWLSVGVNTRARENVLNRAYFKLLFEYYNRINWGRKTNKKF